MRGLTVRWSLEDAADDVADQLRDYVAESSHARFTGMAGLRFKTWRMRDHQWFEGCYVFATDDERAEFQRTFSMDAADSPVSRIVGSPPVLVEECHVVAIAEGQDGFQAASRY